MTAPCSQKDVFVLPDFGAFKTSKRAGSRKHLQCTAIEQHGSSMCLHFTMIAGPTDFKHHGRLMSRYQVPKPKGGAASLPGTSHWPVPVCMASSLLVYDTVSDSYTTELVSEYV